MALVIHDRVKESSTTTGTGTFSLAGAFTDYESFANGIGNNNTTYYTILNAGLDEFEVGLGTYLNGSPNTLSRDTVLSNSLNNTSKINFSAGTKIVFCTLPADKAVYKDASGNVVGGVSAGFVTAMAIAL
jgi:hypothetical protein|tara:strand:+ start:1296 stop:1685 length:390 start_codon:yes stop_codon:yes gene_type:complete